MAVYTRGGERFSSKNSKSNKRRRVGQECPTHWLRALAAAVSLTTAGVWNESAEAARGGSDVKGAKVIAGAAQISSKGNTTTIRAIDKTIIKYDRFNVRKGNTVRFVQPSSSSRVLNRIDGAAPSRIDGRFTANGIVFFVNPAGVMFGPTAVVDVGQLYAGAGSIGDQDFLGGINKFSTSNGPVVNHGKITGEQVHLFGGQVVNRGAIVADGGIVTMSSGKDVFIGEEGGNIMVKVEGGSRAALGGAGVVNSGTINAGKGTVKMMGAGDIYSVAVNNKGLIRAKDITVDAGAKGSAVVSGKLDASDKDGGGVGGKVAVLGDKVALIDATVDASGAAGGGTVLVGGDVQGGGTTPTASYNLVSKTSTINADAISSGNGGKVVVWADKVTAFFGKISARGGASSGNGGFVEVSGKEKLVFKGDVNVTAPNGTAGTLLLDPASIIITDDNLLTLPLVDINGSAPGFDDITDPNDLSDPTFFGGETSVISSGAVEGLLTDGTTLVLAATNNIDVNFPVAPAADHGGSLTLDAPTVNLNATITLQGAGVLRGGDGTFSTTTTVNVGAAGSIQNGVDIVAPGGTVDVAAGTFAGNVSVGKSISLVGNNENITGFGVRNAESVIQGQVQLTAPNTTFKGFTVENVATGAGVVVSNGAGDLIENNIIRNNVFGMSLASDGSGPTRLRVQGNLFDTNTRPGSASGNGIYTDFAVSNVLVDNNRFTGNTEGSVSFFGTGTDPTPANPNITISNNTMTNDGPIGLETVSGVDITGNTINNSTAHAIWIAGGVGDVDINDNLLENNGGAGVIFTNTPADTSQSNNIRIERNAINGNDDGGIVFEVSSNTVTIANNFLTNNGGTLPGKGAGINFSGGLSSGVTITNNAFANNVEGGISLAPVAPATAPTYSGTLNAVSNWWDSGSGPSEAGNTFNVAVQGEAIIGSGVAVNYVRWLDSDGDGAGVGFQPTGALFAPIRNTTSNAFFSNIQAAQTAANPDETLELRAGTFTEVASLTKNITLGFVGDGTLSGGSLTLDTNADVVTITGTGSIEIDQPVSVGANSLTVAAGTTVDISGDITASSGGAVAIAGGGTVSVGGAIGGAIDRPSTVMLSSNDEVSISDAVRAADLITVSAGDDGTGGVDIQAGGSLQTTLADSDISISTGVGGGNVALGGSVTAVDMVSISTPAGTVTQTAAGTIAAARLGVSSSGSVTLEQNNDVDTLAVNVSGANNTVSYRDADGLDINSVGVSGVSTSGGSITITSGALTISQEVNSGGAGILIDSGQLTINQPIDAGTGTVRVVSSAGVTQSGSGTITSGLLGVRAAGTVTLNLANPTANFAARTTAGEISYVSNGALTVSGVGTSGTFAQTDGVTNTAGDVLLRGAGDIEIDQPVSAVAGIVRIVTTGGHVEQDALNGAITAAGLGVRATDDVTLNVASNDVGSFVAAITSGVNKAVRFGDSGSLAIGSIGEDAGGLFATTSGVTASGAVAITSGAIDVNSPVSGTTINLGAGTGELALNANVTGTSATLSGVGVTQGAASTVNAGSGLIIVDANSGAVDMLGTLTTTNATPSAVQILDGSTVDLGTISATSGGLEVLGSGNVTQNTGTVISVSLLEIDILGDLDLGNANNIGSLEGISLGGNDFIVNDVSGGLVVNGPISGDGAVVRLTTAGGMLDIRQSLNATEMVLAGAGIIQSASTNLDANTLRVNSTGAVTLTEANAVGTLAASVSGGGLSFTDSDGLIIGTASSLDGINVGSNTLTISADGSITQSESITAGNASFTSTLAAAPITLDHTSNAISGEVTFAPTGAGDVELFNNGPTNLGASSIGGTLTVESTGAITDSGTLTVGGAASFVTFNNAGAGITLDEAASTFGPITARSLNALGLAPAAGNISIHENGTMDVAAASSSSGSITLEADKIDLGAADTVSSSGALVLRPNSAGADIDLGTNLPGVFSFNASDVAAIADGFSSISIGHPSGTGLVTISNDLTFRDHLSVTGGTIVRAAGTLATNAGNNMSLQATTGTAVGAIGTPVAPLIVDVGGTLTLETDGANANGDIFLTSNGPLTIGANVTTDSGSEQTVRIRASDFVINAANPGTSNDGIILLTTGAVLLQDVTFSGASMLIDTNGGITDTGLGILATTGVMELRSFAGGSIGVDAGNALGVSVGGTLELNPANGDVFVTSPGSLLVGDVNTSGAVQTIDVRTTAGDLRLTSNVSGNDNWVLNSAGMVNNQGRTLEAASVDVDAVTGIGTSGSFSVLTPIISADSSASGLVNVNNSSAAPVMIESLSTGSGQDVVYSQSGGGTATFGPVTADANGNITLLNDGNSVTITAPVSTSGLSTVRIESRTTGDVTVNADVTTGDVLEIVSAGNITGTGTVGGGAGVLVDLTAVTGIGGGTPLNVTGSGIEAVTTGLGAASINLATNFAVSAVTLINVTTVGAGANITVNHTGGTSLLLTNVSAPAGNVSLTATGSILELTNDDAGAHVAEITAINVDLTADGGIGFNSQLDLAASGTVTVNSSAGGASIANNQALTLGASSVNNDLVVVAETGNLTTTDAITATTGNATLTALEAGRTIAIGSTLTVGGDATLTADEIDLNGGAGSVSGTGTLTLQPQTPTQGINIGGAGAGITDTDISAIAGFANIIIGRSNGEHAIVVDSASFPNNVTIRTPSGGSIVVTGQLDTLATAGAHSITLSGPLVTLEGNIVTAGGAVTVNGATQVQGVGSPSVDTTNAGAVSGGAGITFQSPGTINFSGGRSLTLTAGSGGAINITGDVGATGRPEDFTVVSAANTTFGGVLRVEDDISLTSNGLAFDGGANSVSSETNGSLEIAPIADATNIEVGTATGGAATLDIDASDLLALREGFSLITIGRAAGTGTTTIGDAAFKDAVIFHQPGGTINLGGSLRTDAGADSAGAITFDGPVVLVADSTIDTDHATGADGGITFNSTVDGGHNLTASAGGGTINATANIGATPLTTITFSGATINLENAASTGNQSYTATTLNRLNGTSYSSSGGDISFTGAAELAEMVTVAANDISFTGTINSDAAGTLRNLTLDSSGDGITTLGGAVGGTIELLNLTTNADGTTRINGGAVRTSADQVYGDAVVLGANTTLTGNDISFALTLNSDAAGTPRDLTVASTGGGLTIFGGAVGSVALGNLTTNADGTTRINGGAVTTSGDQSYGDNVTLGADTTLAGNDIAFTTTLNSDAVATPRDLTINSSGSGITTFGGAVGGANKLNSLLTNADGTTRINGGSVTTTLDQSYNDSVSLGANTLLTGNDVAFALTLDSDSATFRDLTVDSTGGGVTTFGGAVGASFLLNNLTTNADGTTRINGGEVGTSADQTYNDIAVLGDNTVITGNDISFMGILDSDGSANPRDLTINTAGSGVTTFAAVVGGVTDLNNLTTNADGTTRINGGEVNTIQDQTYNDATTLGANTTLTGNDIAFAGALNSDATARDLVVNTTGTGTTTFAGTVGAASALNNLTTNADGTTRLNGASLRTNADQNYNDAVLVGADATLTGQDVTFATTLNSVAAATPRDLTVNASGGTTFTGVVGATARLRNLSTDAAGNTAINGGAVSTTATQTYRDSVTLGTNTTLSGGGVSMLGTVNSGGATAQDLTVNASGATVFGGEVGQPGRELRNLSTDAAGTLALDGGLITTTVDQTYREPTVTMANDADLAGRNITFNGRITADGAVTLGVDAGSTIDNSFSGTGGAVGRVPIGVITLGGDVDAVGDISLGAVTDRTDITVLPTIKILPGSGGTVRIETNGDFIMAPHEKITVDGSLEIVAGGQALLSDITAGDSITVTAPQIRIRQREASVVVGGDGETLLPDLNTDFVARRSIRFNGDAEVLGTIDDNRRVLFATVENDVSGVPSGTSIRALSGDFSIELNGDPSTFIDLRAQGLSIQNPAAALAGAVAQESRQPEIESSVASSQAAELANLGIFARDLDRASLIAFLEGIVLYNDVPGGKIAQGGRMRDEDFEVTKNRLSREDTQRVLDLYYATYFQTDENGRPIMKDGKRVDNIPAMKKAIEEAVAGYKAKMGNRPGSIDPAAFREYVETTPSQGEALKHMNRLRNLFNEILPARESGSRRGLGITPVEAAISRKALLKNLDVEGIDQDQLEAAILAETGRPAAKVVVKPATTPAN